MISVAPLPIAPAPVPASTANAYVLLVDDHEPSLQRLNELIRYSGHRTIAACSATEAILCCEHRRPRVVVTDLVMPNLDGQGLARWLQTRYPSVPIILMTGQEFDPAALGELQRTFTAVLPKPVDPTGLLRWLDRLMPPPGAGAATTGSRFGPALTALRGEP
jgi:CheY-like chemotaxis protein